MCTFAFSPSASASGFLSDSSPPYQSYRCIASPPAIAASIEPATSSASTRPGHPPFLGHATGAHPSAEG